MRITTFIYALLFLTNISSAQPYVEGGKTRHRFAQLNMGVDYRFFSGANSQSSFINSSGQLKSFQLNNQSEARLIIGGTHFWGHTDFYVAFPVASFGKSGFLTGVETGLKYFPYRIEHNKIRPYIGTSLLTTQFKQDKGADLIRFKYPAMTGLVFNHNKHLIELGFGYNYDNIESYYINTTTATQVKTQPFWFSLGYKFMLETTLSAETDWQNGKTKRLTDTLASLHRLNGFTLGVGFSSAFFLKASEHNKSVAPYIDNHKITVFPEYGIGYYLHKPDLQFNLAFRRMTSQIDGYDFSQTAKRKALTLEAYKFFADYHGFAAFIGAAASYEWLNVTETNQLKNTETESYNGIKPAIVFGWDIRPNRIQSWYLRTNLRYFPNLNVKMSDNKTVPLDQLEFNFIQLVVFPERLF